MKYTWQKLGLLYNPLKYCLHPKLLSHASNPVPVFLKNDTYRIFFNGRNKKNKSSIGAVDIDIISKKIVALHDTPFFTYGDHSSFYPNGVSLGNYYTINNVKYLSFMGWTYPQDKHWYGQIGSLRITKNINLTIDSNKPLLTLDPQIDSLSLSYPWIMAHNTNQYFMWYGSTHTWQTDNGEMIHPIHCATSINGVHWLKKGLAVPYEKNKAQAFSRPSVIYLNNCFHMWFSYRFPNQKYKIGYATSSNGLTWTPLLDAAGITPSKTGWDSEMISYPYVFSHKNKIYMLYNGNDFGKSGFGISILNTF